MNNKFGVIALITLMTVNGLAQADDPIVYPADGQSQDQQEFDEYQCYGWAVDESGFDPMEQPQVTEAPPEDDTPKGGLFKGALLGAAVGGMADGSDGAGTGAAIGGILGGVRSKKKQSEYETEQQQWAQEQAANYQAGRDSYDRAFGACMEARGYTVR